MLNDQTILFLTVQFSMSFFSLSLNVKLFYLTIDRILSAATAPGQSEHGSNGNKGVLHIAQSSSIAVASPSDCLASYSEHSLGEGGALPLCIDCSQCILQFQLTGLVCVLHIYIYIYIYIYIVCFIKDATLKTQE